MNTRVTIIHRENNLPRAMLVELLSPIMAHVTDLSLNSGRHLGAAVTDHYCSICARNGGDHDGEGPCRHKVAFFEAQVRLGPEAQEWLDDLPDNDDASPF